MCEQNKCGQYGKNWTCPPAVQSVDAFRREMASYDTGLILCQVYSLKSIPEFHCAPWRGSLGQTRDERNGNTLAHLKNALPISYRM
jgi:predicted metal-binding protein